MQPSTKKMNVQTINALFEALTMADPKLAQELLNETGEKAIKAFEEKVRGRVPAL